MPRGEACSEGEVGQSGAGMSAQAPGRVPEQVGRMLSYQTWRPSSGLRQGRGAEKGVRFADCNPRSQQEGGAGVWDRPLLYRPGCPERRVPQPLDGCQRGPFTPETSTGSELSGMAMLSQHRPCKGHWTTSRNGRLTAYKALLERPPRSGLPPRDSTWGRGWLCSRSP